MKVVNYMASDIIGKNISELRKAKGITQEMLAEVVGVTSQAVSKWESGGTPDVELLPLIADYFGVTIDKLFSREFNDYNGLEKQLVKYIADCPQEERIKKAFELCWIIETSISGTTDPTQSPLSEILENDDGHFFSQMIFDSGITLVSLWRDLQYFLLMPEPECGWTKELGDKEKYLKIFKLLSDEDILRALYLLYHFEKIQFTPKLLEKRLEISSERAVEVLDSLAHYSLVKTREIELDDEVLKTYIFEPNPAFIALLAISSELIKKPNRYWFYSSPREKPFFVKK